MPKEIPVPKDEELPPRPERTESALLASGPVETPGADDRIARAEAAMRADAQQIEAQPIIPDAGTQYAIMDKLNAVMDAIEGMDCEDAQIVLDFALGVVRRSRRD